MTEHIQIIGRKIYLIRSKEIKIPKGKPNSEILTLINISQTLLEKDEKSVDWHFIMEHLIGINIAQNIAILTFPELSPIASQGFPENYPWQNVNGMWLVPQQLEAGQWQISLPVGEYYLLYIENSRKFSQKKMNFLKLLLNIFALRFIPQSTHSKSQNFVVNQKKGRKALKGDYSEIIGESTKILQLLETIDKVAASDVPVLIQGESGTGKELIARALHKYSYRSKGKFISENCAAIPETLLESELFGYKKGAFTGAYQNKQGLFEIADGGTLFLDEVGDMSLSMQKKLLRTLQNGEIRPVGGEKIKKVDVRLVTATNKDMQQAIVNGEFREDLYYRLNVVNLVSPPLRERGGDIRILFLHFLQQTASSMQLPIPGIDDDVWDLLLNYSWPGNIREMQNEVKRIMALLEGDTIRRKDFSSGLR